jgi:hypothetical protein
MFIYDLRAIGATRRELYGTRLELVFWMALLFGGPLFMGYALDKYPPIIPEPRELTILAIAVFAVAATLIMTFRKNLMPWGYKAPTIMWLSILCLPLTPVMWCNGFFVVANATLDRSPSAEVRTVLDRVNNRKGVTLHSVAHPAKSIFLDLTQIDHDNVERGDTVQLVVKSGVFGMWWISGYTLRRIPMFTPKPKSRTTAPFEIPKQ